MVEVLRVIILLLNQAHAWFHEIAFVRGSVCVCVSVINSPLFFVNMILDGFAKVLHLQCICRSFTPPMYLQKFYATDVLCYMVCYVSLKTG